VLDQRAVLGLLVRQVVIVRQKRGHYRAEIEWTPLGASLIRMAQLITLAPAA
jgi:hypothetical protein